jgi:hypothetical protein
MAMENQMKDNTGAPSVESLVKRGCLFLEDSEWNKADEYFDKALDINPEHAPAYIGKLCAELMVHREESLGDFKELQQGKKFNKPLGEYAHFQKALRFADDSYLKKLNGYDQKIKDSFPKTIPQRFTDEFIKSEIARLEKEIADCDAEIAKNEQDADFFNSKYKEINDKRLVLVTEARKQSGDHFSKLSEIEKELERYNPTFKYYVEETTSISNGQSRVLQRIRDYKSKKTECEAKKQEIEPLAGISCLNRMDVHYNRFVEAMKKESTEDEYKNYANQFRLLEGYKDSAELADKCGKLADEYVKREKKARYDILIKEKNNTSSKEKFNQLAIEFRKMGDYENAAQLANECDKLADECGKREKKARYDALVQEKNSASSEEKYKQLAQEFFDMGNYENAAKMADECTKQSGIFKERQKKARYDELVQEKNNASSEEEYKQLAQKFFDMGNYENAAKMADECTKQSGIFKEQREKQERKEKSKKKLYGLIGEIFSLKRIVIGIVMLIIWAIIMKGC